MTLGQWLARDAEALRRSELRYSHNHEPKQRQTTDMLAFQILQESLNEWPEGVPITTQDIHRLQNEAEHTAHTIYIRELASR